MLELKDIKKDYEMGKPGQKDYQKVEALKGLSVNFRKCEFVSILGQSGCGKTTLLNIIGGLDKYTTGDLIINGKSTKNYKDRDWDNYRNHSIGFIFQSYNLIPHQTVLQNVELALTLSGISKAERVERAKEVLRKVGLEDKMKSRPNQLSGGQMQRVAIARALINNPDIILADEPTGALDSKTSVQIMDLLKEISKDKLIIMVTHNPDLAEQYSTRIIKLLDGLIVNDSNPYTDKEREQDEEIKKEEIDTLQEKKKVKSMSFFTAFSLSLNNLLTKKARTFLVSFAGSIGIIGIALILSISNGVKLYINKVQEDTLSAYPITLNTQTSDYSSMFSSMVSTEDRERDTDSETIYVDNSMGKMLNSMQSSIKTNDLESFNNYLIEHKSEIEDCINAINYTYDFDMQIFSDDGKTQINPTTVFENMGDAFSSMVGMANSASFPTMLDYMKVFEEMIDNSTLLTTQYDVVATVDGKNKNTLFGNLNYNEVVLVLDKNNQLSEMALYMLGVEDQSKLSDIINDILAGKGVETNDKEYSFDDFLGKTFKILPSTDYYEKTADKYNTNSKEYSIWKNLYSTLTVSEQQDFIKNHGIEVKIVGIVRPNKEAVSASITGVIGYTKALTEKMIDLSNDAEIVKQQKETPDYDVLTGTKFNITTDADIENWWLETTIEEQTFIKTMLEFENFNELTSKQKHNKFDIAVILPIEDIDAYYTENQSTIDMALMMLSSQEQYSGLDLTYTNLTTKEKQVVFTVIANLAGIDLASNKTYESNLLLLGAVNKNIPYTISIYAKDFESKDKIAKFISNYNDSVSEEKQVKYSDIVALLMSSITTIIDAISYVLIAFVSVSLVVSSIMIGIITYISVLERIKEIGVLRSIGASKKDIKRVFTSESVIIGTVAGLVGVGITVLLTIPINIIIKHLTNISNMSKLPLIGGILLVLISMVLTFVAGMIPANIASKKDPVIALRTE